MANWLDKYDAPKAENGIEGTMGGLTDVGFNYNGAWGGTMAMGGSMPGAVGFTYARTGSIPSNGPYAKKTKASAQNGKEVEYKELPEITVVGSKDKQTRDFYNNLIDKFSENEFSTKNPYADERIMGKYLGVMNMGKKYGFPKVKTETKSGIYKNAKGHYNPLTKTIYTNNPENWVAEMAHHVQMKDNIIDKGLQWLGNDLVEYIKQPIASLKGEKLPSPYTKEGTVEHEAHSIIQPMLEKNLMQDYKKYRDSELARSRKKRFFLEKRNLQNGGEMKFYQEGLDWKPRNISRDGSEIPVDPMGYWNPDNVGEPVIIPSNEITMQGVYEPLLGISDTGDTQMMYPGEDYEFDGESVTEYPIAQKGKTLPTVNIKKEPIYVDNPRDPRLKAYQDSLQVYNSSKFVKEHPLTGNYIPGKEDERQMNINIDKKNINKYKPKLETTYTGYYYDYKKPVQPVQYRKPEPKKEQPKKEQPKPIERKQNVYEGTPVYSGTIGSGGPSALIGFSNQKGDTTFIKPEDYERFGVPKYGKEFIESRKKQRNGGVNSADAQPIEKLDQLLNFTNYNKPTKGGWLDKYQ